MKIIIIGATTGIGKALAELYINQGHEVTITGGRISLLEEIRNTYPERKIHISLMDVAEIDNARLTMEYLADKHGGFDRVVINAGVGFVKASFEEEIKTIDINVRGFTAIAQWSYHYFKNKGSGHIIGISSLAALKGSPYAPEYHASKAFISNYIEGLRLRSEKYRHHISITDIRPGFVDTPMTRQNKGMFWVASPQKAATQIARAIETKKKVAYITKRYFLLAILMKLLPTWLFVKIF
ncbi:SDR family NAD(P)-dependent oxidoreductase [Emticicia sp. BO119]|uniref:SDR family NAD(P)-dependent oxidoreductase n=1 Tax=Emticicia sp. BO119 TaxID=2757768 RepID=UPI0015F09391|nr:SDR family NAD(P)-dependent oxidoreductase [Emticicia sp. BO119]MBA4850040.1 SDR family NAD(P)-dependent oxidoreductase [Emticicia sp. BO119]